ncbi:hypothetical protein GCM10011514_40900 [Emticicia aquatilis]|uniref:Uncharacterized protein n=1 Tax=Emticicia aquatilis TaxID=1537369 RepID=A0A916Z1T8_9BACT|nr:hypothetical protein GCM10011514_40900 [Emticicia aquatilis]
MGTTSDFIFETSTSSNLNFSFEHEKAIIDKTINILKNRIGFFIMICLKQ